MMPVETDQSFEPRLPPGAPAVTTPIDNGFTLKRVQLGKALFFEKHFSSDRSVSCASCHHPDRAFSDTVALSSGSGGALGFRNAPSLANAAYQPWLFRDGGVPTLEMQVLAPIHDEAEMNSNINTVAEHLRDLEPYRSWSLIAYGRELDPYVITRAIACYERTLVSGWSRYDRFHHEGDDGALTPEEQHGYTLFHSAALGCANCHSGFDLSDHAMHNIGTEMDYTADPGRFRITLNEADRGKFKTPTLRNVALTAPYLHDGSMATLGGVIDHFASGGQPHPNKSPLMQAFTLTAEEKADLIAFLLTLTDERSLDQVP